MTVMTFVRNNSLVSVSKDGVSLPEVYVDLDLRMIAGTSNATHYAASPVSSINSVPIEDFLVDLAATESAQDPDANYNALFPVSCTTHILHAQSSLINECQI